ncbi:unnamed protein product [Parajaminaea phylloscopi]
MSIVPAFGAREMRIDRNVPGAQGAPQLRLDWTGLPARRRRLPMGRAEIRGTPSARKSNTIDPSSSSVQGTQAASTPPLPPMSASSRGSEGQRRESSLRSTLEAGTRSRGRVMSPTWSMSSMLIALILAVLPLTSYVAATRAPAVYERSYPHMASSQLASIAALADAAPSLNHHDPNSFVSKILIPRVAGTEGNHKVREHILDVFQKELGPDKARHRSGWHVEEHYSEDLTPHGKKPFVNLIFTKNPSAPRRIVLSAHYDSKWFDNGQFVGATDSASPCAMLVDLARALDPLLEKKMGVDEETTLQLLFFDGEEAFNVWTHTDSTYGSRALAANWSQTWHEPRRLTKHAPVRKIDSIDHLVLLDLLGAKDPTVPSYFASTHWLFNELVSAEERLRSAGVLWPASSPSPEGSKSFFKHSDRAMGGGIEDDHLPFLANGVPILHIIPTPFPRVWHTMKDDATCLDYPTQYAWAMILRLFTAEYLRLELPPPSSSTRDNTASHHRGDGDGARDDDDWGNISWLHHQRARTELVGIYHRDDI